MQFLNTRIILLLKRIVDSSWSTDMIVPDPSFYKTEGSQGFLLFIVLAVRIKLSILCGSKVLDFGMMSLNVKLGRLLFDWMENPGTRSLGGTL